MNEMILQPLSPKVEKRIDVSWLSEYETIRANKATIPEGSKLVETYETEREIIVMGWPEGDDENHNCDFMGCGSLSHVMYRFDKTQARAASWRVIQDWIEAQIAIIDAGQVKLSEVFFPYLLQPSGETLYQKFENQQLQLGTGE